MKKNSSLTPEEEAANKQSDKVLTDHLYTLVIFALFSIVFCSVIYFVSIPRFLNVSFVIMIFSSLALCIAIGWRTRDELFAGTKKNWLLNIAAMIFLSIFFSVVVLISSYCTNLYLTKYLNRSFKSVVSEYRNDPAGFPSLKRFAKTNFDIDLSLNDTDEAMEYSERKSPASMDMGWNFCSLNINLNGIRSEFNISNKSLEHPWIDVIAIHELGHCLDESRDFNYRITGSMTRSIAPVDRVNVIDFDSLLEAGKLQTTQQWREVEADLIAFGYIQITYPQISKELTTALIEQRDTAQHKSKPDITHNTSCWIKSAIGIPLPGNIKSIVDWADQIRSTANCHLNATTAAT